MLQVLVLVAVFVVFVAVKYTTICNLIATADIGVAVGVSAATAVAIDIAFILMILLWWCLVATHFAVAVLTVGVIAILYGHFEQDKKCYHTQSKYNLSLLDILILI